MKVVIRAGWYIFKKSRYLGYFETSAIGKIRKVGDTRLEIIRLKKAMKKNDYT